ncbi:MAG: autotransporter assembly complex family protein [Gammaproteobacteria bacterium]|nr:autotransporter assembly complex family protein [Gammaproteobacteria bacterium]
MAEVVLRGVNDATEEVLRGFLTVDDLPCDAPRWWVERRHRQAPEQIRRGMEALGHYRSEQSGSLEWGEECWQATYRVEPGDAARIQEFDLEIEGELADQARLRDAVAGLDIAPEEPFSHSAYENAKSALLEVAEDLGYFDARFTRHRVEVNPDTNQADIQLTLSGGERYRVGEIDVGQNALEDELFRRYLRFETGEPFDARALTRTYRNLIESDYFDRVLVAPDIDARADGEVPVRVTATANTRRSALVGAGFATDTGPRGRLDLRYRRVNDRGHRANFTSVISTVNGSLGAEYRLPYGDPTHEWLFVKGDVNYEETDTSESLQRGITLGRTHRRGSAWAETNYVEYTVERFEIGEQEGTSNLLLLGTNWSRSTNVDEPRPLRGYSLSLDVRGAAKQLLSDNNLVQTILRGRQILPLGERFRVIARAQAGWTWQSEFDDLPPSVRFFAGGDNSVRGYGYQELGPEEDGEVIGGERLLTGSLELDALIRPNWSVAAFVDSGSAFNNTPEFSTGVGLGLRWYSPLGPLRFDLAHPLDDPDRAIRLHISLGPDL